MVEEGSSKPMDVDDELPSGSEDLLEKALKILKKPRLLDTWESSLSVNFSPPPASQDSENTSTCKQHDQEDIQMYHPLSPDRNVPRLPRFQLRMNLDDPLEFDDGYKWRNLGQKQIQGCKFPRMFFRCEYHDTERCCSTRMIERCDDDPSAYDILYIGRHTCKEFIQPDQLEQQENQMKTNLESVNENATLPRVSLSKNNPDIAMNVLEGHLPSSLEGKSNTEVAVNVSGSATKGLSQTHFEWESNIDVAVDVAEGLSGTHFAFAGSSSGPEANIVRRLDEPESSRLLEGGSYSAESCQHGIDNSDGFMPNSPTLQLSRLRPILHVLNGEESSFVIYEYDGVLD